ncbi:transposase [Methylobacter svalbardensis]|uniref:transposase n=1 Tax=Methylobacter svalbardensis TaxID=3080016 RepID=UPI003BB4B78A
MSNIINDPVLVSAIQDLARGIKSEADLSSLTRELLKITVEASLNAEMEAHLGYPKHSPTGHNSGNSRNGYGSKSLKGDHGVDLTLDTLNGAAIATAAHCYGCTAGQGRTGQGSSCGGAL